MVQLLHPDGKHRRNTLCTNKPLGMHVGGRMHINLLLLIRKQKEYTGQRSDDQFTTQQHILYQNVNYFLFFEKLIRSAGSKTRLVIVATTSVSEVSQPSACVPPNPLKQKITKPATSTMEV